MQVYGAAGGDQKKTARSLKDQKSHSRPSPLLRAEPVSSRGTTEIFTCAFRTRQSLYRRTTDRSGEHIKQSYDQEQIYTRSIRGLGVKVGWTDRILFFPTSRLGQGFWGKLGNTARYKRRVLASIVGTPDGTTCASVLFVLYLNVQ